MSLGWTEMVSQDDRTAALEKETFQDRYLGLFDEILIQNGV